MLRSEDVPLHAKLHRLQEQPGNAEKEMPLLAYVPEIEQLFIQGERVVIVDAATGSGKTRIIPDLQQKRLRRKLLALNPSRLDTRQTQECTSCPSRYRMGFNTHGGNTHTNARIVFVTVGLAYQEYLHQGTKFLSDYDGVFFDEVGCMESDPQYALLWQVTQHEARHRRILIVGASATISDSMTTDLGKVGAKFVRCQERRFPLERNRIEVPSMDLLYDTIGHIAYVLLMRGESVLVFLPGKREITDMQEALLKKPGVRKDSVIQLHGDLDERERTDALLGRTYATVRLTTSLAETSITIPDVDHVLDSGRSRILCDDTDIVTKCDFSSPHSTEQQRAGRAGRVRRGSATRFVLTDDTEDAMTAPIPVSLVEYVIVAATRHLPIQPESLAFCKIPQEKIESARYRIDNSGLSPTELWSAASLPFSLRDAVVFLRAMSYGVAFEAAALLVFKSTCRWNFGTQFKLAHIIEAVSTTRRPQQRNGIAGRHSGTTQRDDTAARHRTTVSTSQRDGEVQVRNLDKAKRTFQQLKSKLSLTPSSPNHTATTEEVLALAFLSSPERLVWRGPKDSGPACFLGEPLVDFTEQGYFVAILLRSQKYRGLQCSLSVHATDWVFEQSGIRRFDKTAKLLSDSTFTAFRVGCCLTLRALGYDVKIWQCRPGARETDFAVDIMLSPYVDLAIVVPNGNKLARQQDTRELRWIRQSSQEMATSLFETARRAVMFVGHADLSPGVARTDYYARLVQTRCAFFCCSCARSFCPELDSLSKKARDFSKSSARLSALRARRSSSVSCGCLLSKANN